MQGSKLIKYKIILLQLGISQRKLSKLLGVTESYISMALKGKRSSKILDNWMKANAPKRSKKRSKK